MVSIFGGIFITLGVGAFADFAEASGKEDLYFIVCFAGMIVLLLLHTLSLILCKEDATEEEPEKIALGQKIKAFVKDPKIRKILPVTAMYFFGNGFAYTFMFSYWLTELKFSMVMVTVITIIASVARVLVTPAFGRLGDRRSFAYSTSIGALLTAIAYTINIFAYPGPMRWITVVFASIQFLAMTAITSGGINIVYDHVKTEDCGAVYGISLALCGIVSIFASMLGGWVLALVQNAGGLNLFGITIYGQQVLYFISAILLFGMFFYLKIFVCRMKTNKNEEKEYALEDELGL